MKKVKANIVRLPTVGDSDIWSHKGRRLYYNQANFNDKEDEIRYHLYITVKERVKTGDCYLVDNVRVQEVRKVTENNASTFKEKVIATTDSSLFNSVRMACKSCKASGFNCKVCQHSGIRIEEESLPTLSQQFIEEYCNNPVDEVWVEYFNAGTKVYGGNPFRPETLYKLKVTSGNEVVIHLAKTSWNREEVTALLHRALATGAAYGYGMDQDNANSWIKENL